MRKRTPHIGAFLTTSVLLLSACAHAQEVRPFEDVRPDSWAYPAAADLQMHGAFSGYPDGHFSGQKTLTRYEFAVALKRALDGMPADGRTAKSDQAGRSGSRLDTLDRGSVGELQRLSIMFREELIALGVDTKDLAAKLARLATIAVPPVRVPDRVTPTGIASAHGIVPAGTHAAPRSAGLTLLSTTPTLLGGAGLMLPWDGFGIRARIGGGTATLFGGSIGAGSSAYPFLGGASAAPLGGSTLQLAAPGALGAQQLYGPARQANAYTPAFLNYGETTGSLFGIQGDLALSKSAAIGLTYLDYNTNRGDLTGNGTGVFAAPDSDLALYGASIKLNPGGRLALTGEASKSVTFRKFSDDGSDYDDNNAYQLKLKYNGGALSGTAGYQYYDPGFAAPGYVNNLGSWYNPANLQGPFARLGGSIDRLRADVGVDYLTAAKNRPGFGGFTSGSSVIRGQAGLGYHFSKQFELTASYEGILYDMSGAISASGMRAKPVEQYITLGAGLNLSGSTVLRLAYQIINVQDAGNGFGLAPGGSSSGATSAVVTTQFAVHF